jgi:transposase-like protein
MGGVIGELLSNLPTPAQMTISIPTQQTIYKILFNENECKQWLIEVGIISRTRTCNICEKTMNLNINRERYRHKCITLQKETSIWKNTFFSKTKLEPNQIINLLYLWLSGANHTFLRTVGGHSPNVITNFIKDANQMLANDLEEEFCIIGGENIIVELDETKLSKRKYNRGHRVEGIWVIGGVERTTERKMFVVPVENRNSNTISDIIERYVKPGSIIHTDCWRGYSYLSHSTEYSHRTVNHSIQFSIPGTNIHTNSIEGTWSAIKSKISKRYRCENGIGEHLQTFMWRRQNKENLWNGLIKALKDYEYIE